MVGGGNRFPGTKESIPEINNTTQPLLPSWGEGGRRPDEPLLDEARPKIIAQFSAGTEFKGISCRIEAGCSFSRQKRIRRSLEPLAKSSFPPRHAECRVSSIEQTQSFPVFF